MKALLATAAILAAVALAYAATGRTTCDPPRHAIAFKALDGFRTEECVLPTPPPAVATDPRRP